MAFNREKALAAAAKYAAKGQHDKSAREYAAIVEDDPSDIRSWLMLADCLVRSGDRGGAIGKYLKVAKHYVAIDEPQKALAVFRQVLNLDPGRLDIHIEVAELYRKSGHTADAVATYEFVAQSYFQSGKIAEGLEGFKRVAELDNRAVGKRLRLAELYSREGMVKEAVEHFALAASRLLIDQRFDDYIRVAERLIYHKEDELPVLRTLARIYLKKNESRRALVKLNALLRAAPTDPVGLELLGDTFIALGKVDKAVSVVAELAKEQRKAGKKGLEIAARVLRKAVTWEHGEVASMQESLAEVEAELEKLRAAEEPEDDAMDIDVSDVAEDDEDGFDIDLEDSVDMGPEESAPVTEQAVKAHEEHSGAKRFEAAVNVSDELPVEAKSEDVGDDEQPADEPTADEASEAQQTVESDAPAEQPETAADGADSEDVVDAPSSDSEGESPAKPTAEQLEKILVEARVYVNYKMFEHALRHIRGVLAQQPEHREASELKAVILTDLKRHEDAVALYLELIARHQTSEPDYARELLAKALKLAPRNQTLLELKSSLNPETGEGSGLKKIASTQEPEDSKARALRLGSVLRKVASRKPGDPEQTEGSGSGPLPKLSSHSEGSGSGPLPPLASTKGGRATSTDDSGQIRFRAPKPSKPEPAAEMDASASEVVELDVEEFEVVEAVETKPKPPPPSRRPPPPRSLRGLPRRPGAKSGPTAKAGTPKPSISRLGLALGSRLSKGKSKEPSSTSESKEDSDDADGGAGGSSTADAQDQKRVGTSKLGLPTKRPPSRQPPPKPETDKTEPDAAAKPQPDDGGEVAEQSTTTAGEADTKTEAADTAAPGQPLEVSDAEADKDPEDAQEEPEAADADSDSEWPDIADELEELAFFISQGFDDDARFTYMDLDQKYPGHPGLEPYRTKFSSGVVMVGREPDDPDVDTSEPAAGDLSADTSTTEADDAVDEPAEPVNETPAQEDSSAEVDHEQTTADDEHNQLPANDDTEDESAEPQPEQAEAAGQPADEHSAEAADDEATGTEVEPETEASEASPEATADANDEASQSDEASAEASTVEADEASTVGAEEASAEASTVEADEASTVGAEEDAQTTTSDEDERAQTGEPVAEQAVASEEQPEDPSAEPPTEQARPVSPEEALDGLGLEAELDREEQQPEPEPEYEDILLGDEELNEGDDFLSSIFAVPDEQDEAPVAAVKVPARARATIDESADARTLFDLGTAYREMGLVDDAIAQFELAAQDPAWTARSLVMMASLHLHRGETDKAITDLEEAIGCAGTDVERSEARYELSVVFEMVGEVDKAREHLLQVAEGYRDRDERLAELE